MATLSSFTPKQKMAYVGAVNDVLNSKDQFFGWVQKKDIDGGGGPGVFPAAVADALSLRSVNFNVQLGRNPTGTYMDPQGSFPTPAHQRSVQGIMQGRTGYWPMQVSAAIIRRTQGNNVAFAKAMTDEAVRNGNDFRNENERIIMGDGSGTLGVVASASIVSNALAIVLNNYQDLRKFHKGMYLNAFSARTAGATQRALIGAGTASPSTNIVKVSALTLSGTTATVTCIGVNDGTITAQHGTPLAAGDVLTKGNDQQTTGSTYFGARSTTVRYEPHGIGSLVLDCDSPMETSATYGGHAGILAGQQYGTGVTGAGGTTNGAAGEQAWQSYVNRSSTARGLGNDMMTALRDVPTIENGESPTIYVTSWGGRSSAAINAIPIRTLTNSVNLTGNAGGGFIDDPDAKRFIEVDGKPVVPSRYAPTELVGATLCTSMFAINLSKIAIWNWHPIRFIDDDGLTWRMVGRTPYFEAVLEHTWELQTPERNAHSRAVAIIANDYV